MANDALHELQQDLIRSTLILELAESLLNDCCIISMPNTTNFVLVNARNTGRTPGAYFIPHRKVGGPDQGIETRPVTVKMQ
jgi:hypothetical protein